MLVVFGLITGHIGFAARDRASHTIPTRAPLTGGFTTQLEKLRFEARVIVMRDVSLSCGARLVYSYLDDMAAFRGEAHPKQVTIARALGLSLRQVQRFCKELEGRHITSERKLGTASTRALRWAVGTVTPRAAARHATGGATNPPRAARDSLYEPGSLNQGIETDEENGQVNPCDCAGTGFYPVGGKTPCRECTLGWMMARRQEKRRA
jgi:hypothetical protein